jgi:hypothetical protein
MATTRTIAAVAVASALICIIMAPCLGFSTAAPPHHRRRRPTSPSAAPPPSIVVRHRRAASPSSSSAPPRLLLAGEDPPDGRDDRDDPGADEMFARFDSDGNGLIDRREFRAVAREMRASSRRREVLSVATASFGSIFVARGSSTFQFAQKRLRRAYLEEAAESSQRELFPTAMLSCDLDGAVAGVLRGRGFTPRNTLFGHSVCADEANNRREQLVPLMVNRWQEGERSGRDDR